MPLPLGCPAPAFRAQVSLLAQQASALWSWQGLPGQEHSVGTWLAGSEHLVTERVDVGS